jgi:hypothetical protein
LEASQASASFMTTKLSLAHGYLYSLEPVPVPTVTSTQLFTMAWLLVVRIRTSDASRRLTGRIMSQLFTPNVIFEN